MSSARRRLLLCAAALVALALLLATALAQSSSEGGFLLPSEGRWAPLPSELADTLERKARGYAELALGFTCVERSRVARYQNASAEDERYETYDYILVRDPNEASGFDAERSVGGGDERRVVDDEPPFPEPYLWTQLFQPAIRSTMRYQVGEWHTTPWKLAIPISWVSSSPVLDQQRITEWSGTMKVEFKTGNVVEVVARPSFQDQRILMQLQDYLTAWRFLGFSTAAPPEGLELRVFFDFEHEGYTYPTRVELHRFRQVHRDTRVTVSRRVTEYTDYRFFGARVTEDIPPLTYDPRVGAAADVPSD